MTDRPESKQFDWVRSELEADRVAYLVVIQRFRSGGGYTLFGSGSDLEECCQTLRNSGQRHPGFVLRCTAWNGRVRPVGPGVVQPLASWSLAIEVPVILGHVPYVNFINALGTEFRVRDEERAEVLWVGKAGVKHEEISAEKQVCPALLGFCSYIADSEGGSYARYHQDGVGSVGVGSDDPDG